MAGSIGCAVVKFTVLFCELRPMTWFRGLVVALDHDFHDLAEMARVALALDLSLAVRGSGGARLSRRRGCSRPCGSPAYWARRELEGEDGVVLDLVQQGDVSSRSARSRRGSRR